MRSQTFPSEGRCVYCAKPFPPQVLTDEHIVPLALNGAMVIKKAACEPCRDRSNRVYEQPALNADFLVPRLLLELRRRKKNQPKFLPKVAIGNHVQSLDGDFDVQLEVDQYGNDLALVVLPRAGRLVGIERTGDITRLQLWLRNFRDGHEKQDLSLGVTKRHLHDHTATGLTVAKIALCFAAAKLGIDGFDGSEIRSLLNGTRTDLYNFVGCNGALTEGLTRGTLHSLYLRRQDDLLIVIVHLFASFAAPPYEVVVGRRM